MSVEQEEHAIRCPFCHEHITVFVDPSVDDATYTEDCQVCCRPILLSVSRGFEAERSSIHVQRE